MPGPTGVAGLEGLTSSPGNTQADELTAGSRARIGEASSAARSENTACVAGFVRTAWIPSSTESSGATCNWVALSAASACDLAVFSAVTAVLGERRELVARNDCADLSHANVVLGIDEDVGASLSAAGSVTPYDAQRRYHAANLRLAQLVQRDVLAGLSADGATVTDLGVHNDVGYGDLAAAGAQAYGHLTLLGPAKRGYLSTPTLVPAALIEPLYLTNPPEASMADSAAGQEAIARGLADAAEQFLSESSSR